MKSKAVMLSIQPKWCELIASGKKTIEVRKTRPKLETPFKCYIYCTKGKDRLLQVMKDGDENYGRTYYGKPVFIKIHDKYHKFERSGKIIGEFICDRIDEFRVFENDSVQYWNGADLEKSCLAYEELANYIGKGHKGYGWHISDLKIYEQPKELGEFTQGYKNTKRYVGVKELTRPPQSWCYVEQLNEVRV